MIISVCAIWHHKNNGETGIGGLKYGKHDKS